MFAFSSFPGVYRLSSRYFLNADELIYSFKSNQHPQVIDNAKSQDEVLKEFLYSFDVPDGNKISYADFDKYYTNVSACIDSDEVIIIIIIIIIIFK